MAWRRNKGGMGLEADSSGSDSSGSSSIIEKLHKKPWAMAQDGQWWIA